jgi:hypothetical protein
MKSCSAEVQKLAGLIGWILCGGTFASLMTSCDRRRTPVKRIATCDTTEHHQNIIKPLQKGFDTGHNPETWPGSTGHNAETRPGSRRTTAKAVSLQASDVQAAEKACRSTVQIKCAACAEDSLCMSLLHIEVFMRWRPAARLKPAAPPLPA